MFECERCGSSYSASHLGVEHCPRCQLRDQVQSPLALKALQRTDAESTAITAPAIAEGMGPAPAAADAG